MAANSAKLLQKMDGVKDPPCRRHTLACWSAYYQWWPLGKSMILVYMAGFVLTLFFAPVGVSAPGLSSICCAVAAVGAGALLHTISIAARITILQRPPVGTLYESLLFVSLIAVLFGLFLEWRQRNHIGPAGCRAGRQHTAVRQPKLQRR